MAGWGGHKVFPNGSRIYIAQRNFSEGISLRDVHCHNNWRQGLSIISVVNMSVEGSSFTGTNGTAPQFGIDLEPNRVQDALVNVLIRNCSFVGNVGGGIQFGLHKLSDFGITPLRDTTIIIDSCSIDGTGIVTKKNGHRVSQGSSFPSKIV